MRRLREVQGGEPDEDQAYAEHGGIFSERKVIHWFGFSTRLHCRPVGVPVALELLVGTGMHDVSKQTRLSQLMKVKDNH